MTRSESFDVAIIGGGPSGSALGTFVKKYSPDLSVVLLERESFPRDHVGESLLPVTCWILDRMGCWDQIEAAEFPVKVGATYRWGSSNDLWDFDFLNGDPYQDAPRPAQFKGQRRSSAFQVDRSIFDTILLDHAASKGVDVRQRTKVREVRHSGQVVDGLVLEGGHEIKARYYIDASGHSGLLRRSLGVGVVEPSALKNIAIWQYWNNAAWAVTIGASGTRIQVLSLGWGWIWIIPISPTRTSIGLVVPAGYYKSSGKEPKDLLAEALRLEPNVCKLIEDASPEAEIHTTSDWSFMASQMAAENWFLVGEAAGFADPILSAGVSLAMASAEEAATTITALERGFHDAAWLREEFTRHQTQRLRTHIQFADYWYTANAHFTDLVEYTGSLAGQSGLTLKGKDAWQWLGTGGFVQFGRAGVAGFSLAGTTWLVNEFEESMPEWHISRNNIFKLNLEGARKVDIAIYHEGFIEKIPGVARGEKVLPAKGIYRHLVQSLEQTDRIDQLLAHLSDPAIPKNELEEQRLRPAMEALEALVNDGWVTASFDPQVGLINLKNLTKLAYLKKNTDNEVRF